MAGFAGNAWEETVAFRSRPILAHRRLQPQGPLRFPLFALQFVASVQPIHVTKGTFISSTIIYMAKMTLSSALECLDEFVRKSPAKAKYVGSEIEKRVSDALRQAQARRHGRIKEIVPLPGQISIQEVDSRIAF